MTLDVIFRQWDRYSGGNVVIAKDDAGVAHCYATDNGGADVSSRLDRNIGLFSRYDGRTIDGLRRSAPFSRIRRVDSSVTPTPRPLSSI